MQPRPPALETAAARGPPEVRAIPARRMGCLMFRSSVSGVVIAPWVAMLAVGNGDIVNRRVLRWSAQILDCGEAATYKYKHVDGYGVAFYEHGVELDKSLTRLRSVGKCRGSSTCTRCWAFRGSLHDC